MKSVIVVGLAVAAADVATKFEEFEAKYGKNYGSEERAQRMEIFAKNLEEIAVLQAENELATFDHLGPFTDLSPEEFKAQYMGYNAAPKSEEMPSMIDGLDTSNLDERLDWTEKGAANAIKDQKSCGSCWAFSTTANLEGAGFVATGVLASLSEQQLVDCDKNGDMGCSGGLPTNAFGWMKKGHALTDDTSYPYKARGQTCKSSGMKDVTKIKGYSMISKNEDQIAAALATYGPLSIGIDASKFNSYRSGVMTGSCGTRLDHGVAIVGYGVLSGTQYWKIRNSCMPEPPFRVRHAGPH